ncbi:MAG: peptidoglycan DD-metalloendopeptidase family protein [Oscillospiraceae bacterium]|nr:peptidoglycan DD-metalloendopeptidase family protein [Oscillospiraceae bacterium]
MASDNRNNKRPDARRASRAVKPAPRAVRTGPLFRQQRRFPESNSPYRQLRLLLLGSMPRLRQAVHTWLRELRSRLSELKTRLRPAEKPRRAKVQTAVFLAASIAIAVFAVFQVLYTTATTVTFDGVELGTVATEEEAQTARLSVEQSISTVLGYNYTVADRMSYTTGLAFRSAVVDESTLEEALSENLKVVEHGYELYVGGECIGATQTEGAFEELLEQVSAPYRNENTVSIDFREKVEIKEADLPVERFTNLADTALLLNSTKAGEVTYIVEQGDVWSVIAQDNNMSNDELLALNPGYDIDKLQIGDELLISNAVPYLTVVSVQMEYYVAEIPYEIEYVDDDSMYIGDTRVITKGEFGTADTVAQVTYEGTEEIDRDIQSQTMLTQPVTEVQARGTQERPTWLPTGSFRWPTSGTTTSRYGYRNIFGGSSFHGGIDIANRAGTDIVAADGGEVVYAGWQSGYGYLIQIDHGNGYVTYYGHNSELLVSVGDKVYKGQHIAEMGATGRVTGTHCHFEIRKDGERQNPMNYLP